MTQKINQYINHDLSLIVQWLWANRISLSQAKAEIIIFRSKGKIITKHLNFRISGQKIDPINQTKYLGIYYKHLSWNSHLNQLKTILSRRCGLLAKLRYYVSTTTTRSVYFAIFDAKLRYGSQIWGQQKTATIKQIEKLQNKAIRIINFKSKNDPSNPLYKSMKILNLNDVILSNHCMSVLKIIRNEQSNTFSNFFKVSHNEHNYNARGANIMKPTVKTTTYGLNSIKYKSADDWNKLQKNRIVNNNITTETFCWKKYAESLKNLIYDAYV